MRVTLDRCQLTELGIEGWPFGMRDTVRFSELDALNHVNNAVYFSWLEMARIAYLLDYGLTGMSGTEADPQIVIRHQAADYLAPVLFQEAFVITVRTRRIRPSSLVMDYGVYVDGQIRATAETVIVSLTQDGLGRRRWNQAAVARMVERDGAELNGFD